jgi:hypothetical protein
MEGGQARRGLKFSLLTETGTFSCAKFDVSEYTFENLSIKEGVYVNSTHPDFPER